MERIKNPRLKEGVAAFWSGRPECAPSPEALVDRFKCIQGGANEVQQGYSALRRQVVLNPTDDRKMYCDAAKTLTEGSAYTELEQVDERIKNFDAGVIELNECAKKFRAWSEQRGQTSPQVADIVNELSGQLQENLQKFGTVQSEFTSIRDNIERAKREITASVIRALNVCQ